MPRLCGAANPNWKGGRVVKFCRQCGKPFSVIFQRRDSAQFCSMYCTNTSPIHIAQTQGERVARVTVPCATCNNPMRLPPGRVGVKKTCSEECSRLLRRKLNARRNTYSHARRGKRADLEGGFFRSAWEANYARYLNLIKRRGIVRSWKYEPRTFWFKRIKRGVRSYTPDFLVTRPNGTRYYVEIKGWMDPRSKTKIDRLRRYYPKIELCVVGRAEYRVIQENFAGAIQLWEYTR